MPENLLRKTFFGFKYTSFSTVITSLLQIVYTAVISRLLEPKDFGLLAIAQIIINFSIEFGAMGMRQAIIQKKDLLPEDLRVSFTITMGLSILMTLIVWFTASLWTSFFDVSQEETMVRIIRVLSLSFIIRGLGITANALMIREFKFKEDTFKVVLSYFIGFFVFGIGSALLGFGVWSLVFAQLGHLTVASIVPFFYVQHSFKPTFRWKYYVPLMSYGSKMVVTGLVGNFAFEAPKLMIGKLFNEVQLGLFRQASWLIYVPMIKIVNSLQIVLFPVFSKMQSDIAKSRKSFLAISLLFSIIIFPACLGMSAAAREIILLMFGEKYLDATNMLIIICFGIGFRFVSQLLITLCDANARLNARILIEVFYSLLLVIAGILVGKYGILAYLAAISIIEFCRNLALTYIVSKILKIPTFPILIRYGVGLLYGLISASLIFLFTSYIHEYKLPVVIVFIGQLSIGLISISILIMFFSPTIVKELFNDYIFKMNFFRSKIGKRILRFIKAVNKRFITANDFEQ